MLYKKVLFLILGFSLIVISYADVIIINSGGNAVNCKYGANPGLPDNIFSVAKFETRFVGYEANGLLSCEGYEPSHLIEHDEVTIYLDDKNKVINTYEESGSSCKPQVKDCEVSYIVNTYYNPVICYSYSKTSRIIDFMGFSDSYHFTKFPHSKSDEVTCEGISDNVGFGSPENKILLLLINADSLWLLPSDVDYNK